MDVFSPHAPIQCLLQLWGGVFDQLTVPKVEREQCQSAGRLGLGSHSANPTWGKCLVVDQFAYGNSNISLEATWQYWGFSANCDHWAKNLQSHPILATDEHLKLFLVDNPEESLFSLWLKQCIYNMLNTSGIPAMIFTLFFCSNFKKLVKVLHVMKVLKKVFSNLQQMWERKKIEGPYQYSFV